MRKRRASALPGQHRSEERPPRLHPGISQKVAPNENQRGPKPKTSEALIYEALFVAPWLQSDLKRAHNPYLKTLRRSIVEFRSYGVSLGSRDLPVSLCRL